MCKECIDVCHWLLQCAALDDLRQLLLKAMAEESDRFLKSSDGEKEALILSLACRNYHILSIITSICVQLGFCNVPRLAV